MNWAIKLLAAAALLAAVATLGLKYGASRYFAQAAEDIAPFAELRYDSSFAWPNGRFGLNRVTLRPLALQGEEITADRLSLDAGGLSGLVGMLIGGRSDELPSQAGLRVEGLRLSAGLDRQMAEQASTLGYLALFEALGCNPRGRFGPTDYAELGWNDTRIDLDLDLRSDRSRGTLAINSNYAVDPVGQLQLEVELSGMPASAAQFMSAQPRVDQIGLRYDERGSLARRNTHCAAALGVDESAFLRRHFQAVRDELEVRGAFPEAPVWSVYQEFAAGGGVLELALRPNPSVPVAEYGHYKPADRLNLLNASLRRNDGAWVPVQARFFSEDEIAMRRAAGDDIAAREAGEAVRVVVDASAADQLVFEELDELVGRRISVHTDGGVNYVGTLLGTQGPLVRIEVSRSGRATRMAVQRGSIVGMQLAD